ncbi:hypothetical protein DV26_04110 [Amycolatopsis mediterranei]|nr:hypothetical protein DV26_04110 [Amycolatopsis mediterranei]KDU91451.1 hypothetical protein DV36_15420 [Amycolatopsis mediterranei]
MPGTGRPAHWPKAPPGANRWTGSSPSPSLASSPATSPTRPSRAAPVRRCRGPPGSRFRAAKSPRRCTRRASRRSSSPSRPARSRPGSGRRPVGCWCWSACLPQDRRRRTRARWTGSRAISRPASEPGSARLAE